MNPCIIITVRAYLAAQLDCTPEDLSGSGVLYVPNRTAQPPFLKLAVIGGGVWWFPPPQSFCRR